MKEPALKVVESNRYQLPIGVPQPLHDTVVVQRLHPEEETREGIIKPQGSQDQPYQAVIIAVGPGHWQNGIFIMADVQIVKGAHVFVHKYAGVEFEVERSVGAASTQREKYVLCKVDEILGIFDPEDEARMRAKPWDAE